MDSPVLSRRSVLSGLGAGFVGLAGYGLAPVIRRGSPPTDPPVIVGHRGAEGLEPPNTMAGIRRALEVGVDGIELDVWQTADDELLLFHDAVLDWASTGSGLIEVTPWEDIEGAHIDGEPLITLPDALEELEGTDVEVYLELKTTGYTSQVLEEVAAYGMLGRTTLVSFLPDALDPARDADVRIGLVGTLPTKGLVTDAVECDSTVVLSHYVPHAGPRFLDHARDANLTAGLWKLLETSSTLHDSLEANPDVLVTNYPDRAFEMLE